MNDPIAAACARIGLNDIAEHPWCGCWRCSASNVDVIAGLCERCRDYLRSEVPQPAPADALLMPRMNPIPN